MAGPPSDLVAAIKNAAPNDLLLQEALLVGSWGEGGWTNTYAGYYGFTTFDQNAATQTPAEQTQAILSNYQGAEAQLPQGLQGPAAAEWIALGGERPAFSTPLTMQTYGFAAGPGPNQEYQPGLGSQYVWDNPATPLGTSQQEEIQATQQPTQYGANTSFNQTTFGGVWSQINSALGAKVGSGGITPTPTSPSPGSTNIGSRQTWIPPSTSVATPNTQGTIYYKNQFANALESAMQSPVGTTYTDAQGKQKTTYGFVQDVEGLLTGGFLGNPNTSPVHLLTGETTQQAAESVLGSPLTGIWNIVKGGLVRAGIGIIGILLVAAGLWIIVSKVGGGGAVPIPVPV